MSLTFCLYSLGTISQWGEVSKQKKDKSKAKAKDTFTTTTGADAPSTRPARGGRADGGRGRGRATERGARGAVRGRSAAPATNGARAKESQPLSVPTDESNAWNTTKSADDGGWAQAAAATSWEAATASQPASNAPAQPVEPAKSTVIPQSGASGTWANMVRQSIAPKPAPQHPKETAAPKPEPSLEPLPAAPEPSVPAAEPEPEPEPEPIAELSAEPQRENAPEHHTTVVVPEVALPPSKDQLTETNLEQVVDESHPPVTDTVASEAADSWDPRAAAVSATATPLSASQAHHQAQKTPASGYAATAMKATERAPVPRTPSHQQRRFLDQQEAVRMPVAANQQLERTTVQFGAFNLNGGEDDIDGDREEPETRAQPPADSPVTQPRASLPPAPPAAAVPDAFSAQKPASVLPPGAGPAGTAVPDLPEGAQAPFEQYQRHHTNATPAVPPSAPAAQQPALQGSHYDPISLGLSIQKIGNNLLTHIPSVSATVPQPPTQPAAQQFGRFGQPTAQEQPAFPQKPFDYQQPSAAQSQFEAFQSQQQPSQSQPQSQQPGGAYSSAADQYSSYYTADQQGRPPYYYGGQNYGQQQAGQGQQEAGLGSRAGFGGYGTSQGDLASQYPQSANQSRFGAAVAQDQNSGNTTPNPPPTQAQQPAGQGHPQAHGAQQQHGNQFFGQQQPYYGQYYSNYMNNQYGGYGGGFGPYGGKGGVYGQPHHYQNPYDHGSSPATGYPQSSLHRADSGAGSGLDNYGRAGSAQAGGQPGLGSSGFGGIHDAFGRGASSYGAQTGQAFNVPSSQPGGGSVNDDLKPFNDAKAGAGPSPSLGSAARPGSATNTAPSQSGLPPPQSAQQGMGSYGGYPSHLQGHGLHGTQSGATGYGMGAGNTQAHQNSPYTGGYGGFGGNSYYNSHPSQRGGWGNNYGGGAGSFS